MKSLKLPTGVDGDQEQRFADAFAIAKEALTYIGAYRTPPTPAIYRLWYHFVEGTDEAFKSEVASVVARETLDASRLEAISHQYFPDADNTGLHERAGQFLNQEIAALQRLLEQQSHAGSDLQQAIQSSNASLRKSGLTLEEAQACIDEVLASNARMQARLAETELQLAASQQHVDKLRQELLDSQKAMLTDNLTAIGNRRCFELVIQQALDRRGQPDDGGPCREVLTLVDLDGFKSINDTLGHIAGDEVLRFAAQEMQRLVGDGSIARLGGDEFAMLQRVPDGEPADGLGQAIKGFFNQKKLVLQDSGTQLGRLTASIGVAILRGDDDRLTWIERADKLLYSAKQAGRNCVMCERELR